MSALLVWIVYPPRDEEEIEPDDEPRPVIVAHDEVEARALALHGPGASPHSPFDVPTRDPRYDGLTAFKPYSAPGRYRFHAWRLVEAEQRAADRIYRGAGWHDGHELPCCDSCGLHEWQDLPESTLCCLEENEGVCGDCVPEGCGEPTCELRGRLVHEPTTEAVQ